MSFTREMDAGCELDTWSCITNATWDGVGCKGVMSRGFASYWYRMNYVTDPEHQPQHKAPHLSLQS